MVLGERHGEQIAVAARMERMEHGEGQGVSTSFPMSVSKMIFTGAGFGGGPSGKHAVDRRARD